MGLKIIVDSGSDIPIDIAKKYNIDILPLTVISKKDEVEYRDGVDIVSKELTDRMRKGEVFTTSQVTYEQFYEKFNDELNKGNEILYISLSGGISGCYNSGVMAQKEILRERPEAKIYAINSKCASLAIGLVTIRVAKLIEKGMDTNRIIEKAKFLCDNIEHYFTVDDMQYLYRGGRVTATQKILGGILNIKPMLTVDKKDGTLIPMDKGRGLKQVLRKVVNKIQEVTKNNPVLKEQTIAIAHSDCEEDAMELKNMLHNELGIEDILIGSIGSTISAHTGPGCIAVFINKDEIGDGVDTFVH